MLFRVHARGAHGRCKPVGYYLRERPGILVRHDARDGPRRRSVLGRKRIPPLPELALVIVRERAFAAEPILESVHHRQTIGRGFPGQQSRLALVIVMRHLSPQIEPARGARHRSDSIIRKVFEFVQPARRIRQMPARFGICRQHGPRRQSQRRQPIGVHHAQVEWACPNLLLIARKIFQQMRPQRIVVLSPTLSLDRGLHGRLRGVLGNSLGAAFFHGFGRAGLLLLGFVLGLDPAIPARRFRGCQQTATHHKSFPPSGHSRISLILQRKEERARHRRRYLRGREGVLPLHAPAERFSRHHHGVSRLERAAQRISAPHAALS